jgi:peroxiredoxin
LAQVRRQRAEIEALGARLWIVSFGLPAAVRRWRREHAPDTPTLLDPRRDLYRAYGLQRSRRRSLGPRVLVAYVRLILTGRRPARGGDDWTQLGGDFVVDAAGTIRLARPSRDAADRPTWDELEAALKTARAPG